MKKKNIVALICNSIIVLSTLVIVGRGLASESGKIVDIGLVGLGYLKAFTTESNILNGLVALMVLTFNIDNLCRKKNEMPTWLASLQLVATCSVTLTFLTVVFFLSPIQVKMGNSYFLFFSGELFHTHFLNPILAMIVCFYPNRKYKLNKKITYYSMLPMIIYSIIYVINVLITKKWADFYGFTFGGKVYMAIISLIVMYFAAYIIGFILLKIHNGRRK